MTEEQINYLAGYITADGNLQEIPRSKYVYRRVQFVSKDVEFLRSIHQLVAPERPLTVRSDGCAYFFTSNGEFVESMMELGLRSGKSRNPQGFMRWTEPLFAGHFLRGLLDGDGGVYRRKDYLSAWVYFVGTPAQMDPISGFLSELSIPHRIPFQLCGKNSKLYQVSVGSSPGSEGFT